MCLFCLCTLYKIYSLRTCNMPALCWHWYREIISQDLFRLSRDIPSIKPVEPLVLRNSNSQASPQHSPYLHTPMGTWFLLRGITSFKSLSSRRLVLPVHWGGHGVYEWVFCYPFYTRLTISFQYPLPVSVSLGCLNKQEKFITSTFQRLEVWDQGVGSGGFFWVVYSWSAGASFSRCPHLVFPLCVWSISRNTYSWYLWFHKGHSNFLMLKIWWVQHDVLL